MKTKIGNFELNQIYCGDCAELMTQMPSDCIDLTVTSPPYDNLRDYEGYSFNFESIAQELYRITKVGGVLVWVVGDATINGSETGTSFRQALYFKDVCGFNLHDTMIYQKQISTWNYSSMRYKQNFEFMFVLVKGKLKTFNPIRDVVIRNLNPRKVPSQRNRNKRYEFYRPRNTHTVRDNIFSYLTGSSSADSIAFEHPAIFPEALARDHILSWSNPNDIVFDPMVGSGTTCKNGEGIGTPLAWF